MIMLTHYKQAELTTATSYYINNNNANVAIF